MLRTFPSMTATATAARDLRMLALVSVGAAMLIAARPGMADEAPTPDATVVVSSASAASALGLTLVEGTLRHHGQVYLLTLRGAKPSTVTTGNVYGLARARDIEGSYAPADGAVRNDRGVTIVFDPPLELTGGRLEVDLASRVYPKASTGQRGTIE
jgi:hypothetical protein